MSLQPGHVNGSIFTTLCIQQKHVKQMAQKFHIHICIRYLIIPLFFTKIIFVFKWIKQYLGGFQLVDLITTELKKSHDLLQIQVLSLVENLFFKKKSFTRFALQTECCNFNQWEAFKNQICIIFFCPRMRPKIRIWGVGFFTL